MSGRVEEGRTASGPTRGGPTRGGPTRGGPTRGGPTREAPIPRYDHVAVGLHWLTAILIAGLLAVGKYMTSLAPDDPLRFTLTQWHKSFGITVLSIVLLRILWRLSHRPPPEPDSVPRWQQRAAHVVHLALYALMLAIPLTGWILVSASPLDVDTILFDVIPWPHLPPFPELASREAIAHAFEDYHELAGNLLIVLLLAHVGAALKHHFVDRDTVLLRMLPDGSRAWKIKLASFGVAVAAFAGGLWLYATAGGGEPVLAAGESDVVFVAGVTGSPTEGRFPETTVEATLDPADPAASRIEARVVTGGVESDNAQMASSLPDPDWFDSEAHPEATFESTAISGVDATTFEVAGRLTIKGNAVDVVFPMTIEAAEEGRVARGEFTVDRRDFALGTASQPTEEYVDHEVLIRFRFELGAADG